MSTIIRGAPLTSSETNPSVPLRKRFPWLKRNYVCVVWVQPIGKPNKVLDEVDWLPVILDTGYNGAMSMRLEHFADIGGDKLLDHLKVKPEIPRPTSRGWCSTVELNARICANVPWSRAHDTMGHIEVMEFSTGVDLFLPGEYDPSTGDVVPWDSSADVEHIDPRSEVPLLGMQALLGNGLSFLINAWPKGKRISDSTKKSSELATFHIANQRWWPWL